MIDYKLIVGKTVDTREVTYRTEDSILYALSLGFGADPCDKQQLRYVYEDGIETLPGLSMVLGYPGFWLKDPQYQVQWQKCLHAEEHFVIHHPMPPAGTIRGVTVVDNIVDRGPDKGAFFYIRKDVISEADGIKIATVYSTTLARGDGGFGGPTGPRPDPVEVPNRKPDLVCDIPTLPQQALIYRLCGDFNPLHADPEVAKFAGFERPILHGRCTMGIAQHAILKTCCNYESRRMKSMRVRFSAPFLPGETLRTEIWREGLRAYFTASSLDRGVQVLGNGLVELNG
ncbi:MAG: 3-alpha,7-alpha,12-alpha-trihydroxy-5-beta-cholest-24-enoyl-CoA hydratase [Gammaproteobacteria bacterium]|nr:3-alpha,7-alpha,12-alpha-trihydroxy-5-beta-cholest-24-enoyl-CoA hydratase [Gammaproteobacteria bacterium]MBI5615050.1 3-alpha,7-alpha,12-alpha-trihydroxy-5-beta-cholest-24-enoyl-CoA hydratase [Gammaproteobacteria bacterium]